MARGPQEVDDLQFVQLDHLDDEALVDLIRWVRREARRRYEYATELYGVLCPEGKRRYAAYRRAKAILDDLCDERATR